MSLNPHDLKNLDFQTQAFRLKEVSPGVREVSLQVLEDGLEISFGGAAPVDVHIHDVNGWEFADQRIGLAYRGPYPGDEDPLGLQNIWLQTSPKQVDELRRQFNLLRLSAYARSLPEPELEELKIEECPSCHLLFNASGLPEGTVRYCPECHSLHEGEEVLSQVGREAFNFCSSGLFSMIGRKSQEERKEGAEESDRSPMSFYDEVSPVVSKIFGHVLWGSMWLGIVLAVWYPFTWGWLAWTGLGAKQAPYVAQALYLLMLAVVVHVVFVGYYVTGLVMSRSVIPLIFPKFPEKLARLVRRGRVAQAEALLTGSDQERHPGLLADLAVGYSLQGNTQKAWHYLQKAIDRCPNHPFLLNLAKEWAPTKQQYSWQERVKTVFANNELRRRDP